MKMLLIPALAASMLLSGCGAAYNNLSPEGKLAINVWSDHDQASFASLEAEGVIRPAYAEAIREKKVSMGMNHFEVIAAWGWPEVHNSVNVQGQWMQLAFPSGSLVELLNDQVVSIDQ